MWFSRQYKKNSPRTKQWKNYKNPHDAQTVKIRISENPFLMYPHTVVPYYENFKSPAIIGRCSMLIGQSVSRSVGQSLRTRSM